MIDKLVLAFTKTIKQIQDEFLQMVIDKSPLGDYTQTKEVLTWFFNSFIDISLNERTIHFYHSGDVIFDGFFSTFEDIVKRENKYFCKKFVEVAYNKKNIGSIDYLFEEYSNIFTFLPVKTLSGFEQIKSETIIKFFWFMLKLQTKKISSQVGDEKENMFL